MALPVALAGTIAASAAFQFTTFIRRNGVRLMVVGAFVAATVTMVSTLKGVADGISATMPPEFSIAASWVVWPDALTQVSIYLSALFTRWLYDNQVWLLEAKGR